MKTKKNPFYQFTATSLCAVTFASFAMSSSSNAQSIWDGGDVANGSWAAANNWSTNVAPAFNNTTALVFDNVTRATTNSYFGGATRLVKSISFGANIDGTWTTATTTGSVLTFSSDTGTATLNVDALANAQIGFLGGAGFTGFQRLNSNLEINHNGSGEFTWNRQTDGVGGITKNGIGTFIIAAPNSNSFTGAVQVNAGKLVMGSTSGASGDFNTSSGITLNGGILEIQTTSALSKSVSQNLTVSSASTFAYNNTTATNLTMTLSDTTLVPSPAVLTLNANLTLKNISDPTQNNAVNISRSITGSGNLIVETFNPIDDIGDNFIPGRVQLSGSSPLWNGNFVITKGTVQISGGTADVIGSGAGTIVIGETGNASGAGLTFNTNTNVTYLNPIIVSTGGFRAIKGSSFNNSIMTFSGAVTLNGNLTLDHSRSINDRRIGLSGPITGAGGLTITRAEGDPGSTALLSGTSDYLGATTVTDGASLSLTGSLESAITVQNNGRFGGNGGSTNKTLTLESGAKFFFYLPGFAPFNVTNAVSLDATFGVDDIVGGSQGEVVPWATIPAGTYTLIGATASTFNHIQNFGIANAAIGLAGGRTAYFQNGGGTGIGGLQMVVNSGYAAWQIANGNTPSGFDEDHDGDGVDNGTEYFLSGSTSSTGFTPLPGVTGNSVTWVKGATYTGAYTTDFVVEISDTLEAGSWTAAITNVADNIPGTVYLNGNNVKYTFPTTGPKKFARLKVTGPN